MMVSIMQRLKGIIEKRKAQHRKEPTFKRIFTFLFKLVNKTIITKRQDLPTVQTEN